MSLKRTRRENKKSVYKYDAELKPIKLEMKLHPTGFTFDAERNRYVRRVQLRQTPRQIESQATGQIGRYEKKINAARNNLEHSKNPRVQKKWRNELRKLEEKQSNAIEKFQEPGRFAQGFEEERRIITTAATIYATGTFTDGKQLTFRCQMDLTYVEGMERDIARFAQTEILNALESEGAYNLDRLATFNVDAIEGI